MSVLGMLYETVKASNLPRVCSENIYVFMASV